MESDRKSFDVFSLEGLCRMFGLQIWGMVGTRETFCLAI